MIDVVRFVVARRVCEDVLRNMPVADLSKFIAFVAAEANHLVFSKSDIHELYELGEQGDHRIGREMLALLVRSRAYVLGL